MAQRKTLMQAQLDLLQWIEDGCPDGVYADKHHRISAAALKGRGLVEISGRRDSWEARLTPDGREYLKKLKEPGAPPPRQPNVSVTEELIRQVEEAGGVLKVERERGSDGVDYSARVRAAIEHGKVPARKKFSCRWAQGVTEIRLDDLAPGFDPDPIPVPVPEKVSRYHPVVKQFRAAKDRHEVSRAQMSRVLRILQGLVVAAEAQGWTVATVPAEPERSEYDHRSGGWSGSGDGHLVITAGEYSQALRVSEEGLPSRTHWERELLYARPSWMGEPSRKPLGEYEAKATGRLEIELVPAHSGRKWADRKSWTLEEKLPEVLEQVEIEEAAARNRREEAERREAERRVQWEAAMERAAQLHLQAHRAEHLDRRVGQWRRAEDIRAYCDALEARHGAGASSEWVEWARSFAERIDPLTRPPEIPADPENVRPDELKPFLGGWSPYGPDGWR